MNFTNFKSKSENRHSCIKRGINIIWEIRTPPVLNYLNNKESKRGENKTWANISVYTETLHEHSYFIPLGVNVRG